MARATLERRSAPTFHRSSRTFRASRHRVSLRPIRPSRMLQTSSFSRRSWWQKRWPQRQRVPLPTEPRSRWLSLVRARRDTRKAQRRLGQEGRRRDATQAQRPPPVVPEGATSRKFHMRWRSPSILRSHGAGSGPPPATAWLSAAARLSGPVRSSGAIRRDRDARLTRRGPNADGYEMPSDVALRVRLP